MITRAETAGEQAGTTHWVPGADAERLGAASCGRVGRRACYFNDYAGAFKARAEPLWSQAVLFAAGRGAPPRRPHQVEIHAHQQGRPVCPNRCVDCCGRFLFTRQGLPAEVLVRLYGDLIEMGVSSVVLSGNHSDPACLEPQLLSRLIRMGGPTWGIKFYTFGLDLDRLVEGAILEAAEAGPHDESYITFSKLTTDPMVIERLCRPIGRSGCEVLRLQDRNLNRFFRAAERKGFPLRVSLNCRLTRINGDPASLADLLRWFADHAPSPVQLRVTTDFEPTAAPECYRRRFVAGIYLPPEDARQALGQAVEMAALSAEQRERIVFRAIRLDGGHDVSRCLSRLLFAAVSPEGMVFPCPGIAGRRLNRLAYGDLKEHRFPRIWARFLRSLVAGGQDPIRAGCPHCATECDRQICLAIAAEAKGLLVQSGDRQDAPAPALDRSRH